MPPSKQPAYTNAMSIVLTSLVALILFVLGIALLVQEH